MRILTGVNYVFPEHIICCDKCKVLLTSGWSGTSGFYKLEGRLVEYHICQNCLIENATKLELAKIQMDNSK